MATITFGRLGTRPYGVLLVQEMATSVVNNTSTVSITLTLKRPYSIASTAQKTAVCTVNGQTFSWSGSIGGAGDLLLISKTITVPHNADGTKTISMSASIQLDLTWSGEWVGTISGSGTMQLSALHVNKPTIGTCTYYDVNSTTTAVTGNNQLIVQNRSSVKFNITGLTATNATLSSVTVSVNDTTYKLTISGSTATNTGITINSGTDVTAVVKVTDSKGLSTTKNMTIKMIAWHAPTAIIAVARKNNYYSETSIKVDADYAEVGNNAVSITYTASEDTGTLSSVSGELQSGTATTVNLDNEYSWTLSVKLTDTLGGTTTYKTAISRGMPIIYFDNAKSSVGINCFPTTEKSLEVNGVSIVPALFFTNGETITMTALECAGIITNNNKNLRFSVILPKFYTGKTPTVNVMKVNIRSVSGGYIGNGGNYIDGGWDIVTKTNLTVSHVVTSPNIITFDIANTSAYTNVNNVPVAVTLETLKLTFN